MIAFFQNSENRIYACSRLLALQLCLQSAVVIGDAFLKAQS
jgi:hypothetical protein